MYFKRFPTIYYPVNVNGERQFTALKDITINVRFIKEFLSNITLYDLYDIGEGETPEIISEKFYGTPFYHWLIMLVNEKYDYLSDFPLTQAQLQAHTIEKYGIDNVDGIHHYENDNGFIVNSDAEFAVAVTNTQYEDNINESKRTIKIINRTIIEKVVRDFVKIVK